VSERAVLRRAPWLFAAAALVAVAAGFFVQRHLATRPPPPPPEVNGYVLPMPRALSPAMLIDDRGEPFAMTDFAGHWTFVYFGYTYCPDVCPLALVELASVKKKLAERLPDVDAEYYFVSVDPARDTPERLHDYVVYFDPEFHAVTGEVADLQRFANETGSVFLIPEGQSEEGYLVSHSSNVIVLDPEGNLAAVITPPHEPDGIADDFAKIVAYRRGG